MSRWFDDGRQTCNEISNWTVTAATAAETAITGHAATRTKTQNSIWIKQKNKNKCESEKIQEMQRALLCYYTKCVYIYERIPAVNICVCSERTVQIRAHTLTHSRIGKQQWADRETYSHTHIGRSACCVHIKYVCTLLCGVWYVYFAALVVHLLAPKKCLNDFWCTHKLTHTNYYYICIYMFVCLCERCYLGVQHALPIVQTRSRKKK